jgi:RimJ/RimL family protein N-acetyltransferase/N-acetylglutamate synthase-like GNAT family acetyltransferase
MATLAVSIRPAEQRDAETIAALLAQLGYTAEPEEVRGRLARLGSRTDAGALVAVVSDEPVGVASYQLIDVLERSHPQCRVTTLVVDSGHRHGGVATRLVGAIEAFARERGCFRLEVTTRQSRADAAGFYAALGFRERPLRLVKPLLEVVTGPPTLHGTAVTLRGPRPEDVEARIAAGRDPEVAVGYGIRVRPRERLPRRAADAWLRRIQTEELGWIIEYQADAVGAIRLHHIDFEERQAFVAVGLFRGDLLGRGVGTDALRTLMRWASGEPLVLRCLRLRVAEFNARAIASYRKCGFVADGRDDRAFELDGRWHADVLMSVRLD